MAPAAGLRRPSRARTRSANSCTGDPGLAQLSAFQPILPSLGRSAALRLWRCSCCLELQLQGVQLLPGCRRLLMRYFGLILLLVLPTAGCRSRAELAKALAESKAAE